MCIAGYTYQQETGLCHTLYGLGYRYVSSLYWAFTTMTTVGYGDITATTLSERIYNIFSLIVGGFVFSGIISRCVSLTFTTAHPCPRTPDASCWLSLPRTHVQGALIPVLSGPALCLHRMLSERCAQYGIDSVHL